MSKNTPKEENQKKAKTKKIAAPKEDTNKEVVAPKEAKPKEAPATKESGVLEAMRQEVRELRKKVKSLSSVGQTNERLQSELREANDSLKSLRGSNKELTSKCVRMRNILMLGNCSNLSLLVEQFIGFTTPMINQIVLEAHIAEFDKEVREKILQIIKYLTETAVEFQYIIELPTFQIETSSSKKQLKDKGDKIRQSIKRINSLSDTFDESQLKLLCTQYNEFQKLLDSTQNTAQAVAETGGETE